MLAFKLSIILERFLSFSVALYLNIVYRHAFQINTDVFKDILEISWPADTEIIVIGDRL